MAIDQDTKVVLKQRILQGADQSEHLQRVATVYINGKEYRVSAPPEAKGDALDWAPHFTVRQLVDINSEIEILDAPRALALEAVRAELENQPQQGERDDRLPLYRRAAFDRELVSFVRQAVEKARPLSLLMLDLDKFKGVNDQHGHPVGDEVLLGFAQIVAAQVEKKGKAYRYGGEEVAVLLPNFSPMESLAVGEELRKSIEKAKLSTKALNVTVSVGVACFPDHAKGAEDLLKHADAALYQAKKLGRNLVRVSGEPESRPVEIRIPLRRQPAPSEEQEILREAAQGKGQILWVQTDQHGAFISAGERTFPPAENLNMYESKKARERLQSLLKAGLIELVSRDGSGGEVYELTAKGFETAGHIE